MCMSDDQLNAAMCRYLTIDFFVDSFLALVDCPHMLGHVTLNMENVLPF
jgi:hypothetical protein